MSKKIKFSVFELLVLGGVGLFMAAMTFVYHRPEMLTNSLYGISDLREIAAAPGSDVMTRMINEISKRQFNLLLSVFGSLFLLFWVLFVVTFYLLQRRSFRKERKKYLKEMNRCEARIENFSHDISLLLDKLENNIKLQK